jgi:hypothetical protein
LLRSVVKIALEAASLCIAGLDDPGSRGTQLPLLALAFADVGEDHHVADDPSAAAADWRRCDLDVDQRPVLALPVGLDVWEHSTAADGGQHVFELGLLGGRNNRHRPPDDLFTRPTEDPFGGGVPSDHARLKVDLENADRRGVDDGPQPLLRLVKLFELRLARLRHVRRV